MRFNVFTMTDLIGWQHTVQQLRYLHHRIFLHLNTLTLIAHISENKMLGGHLSVIHSLCFYHCNILQSLLQEAG